MLINKAHNKTIGANLAIFFWNLFEVFQLLPLLLELLFYLLAVLVQLRHVCLELNVLFVGHIKGFFHSVFSRFKQLIFSKTKRVNSTRLGKKIAPYLDACFNVASFSFFSSSSPWSLSCSSFCFSAISTFSSSIFSTFFPSSWLIQ